VRDGRTTPLIFRTAIQRGQDAGMNRQAILESGHPAPRGPRAAIRSAQGPILSLPTAIDGGQESTTRLRDENRIARNAVPSEGIAVGNPGIAVGSARITIRSGWFAIQSGWLAIGSVWIAIRSDANLVHL
jgi:hypothetical protein